MKWKCKDRPDLDKLLAESGVAVNRMTPEQREEMFKQQAISWSKQDMD